MTDHDALHAAVRATPEDDTVRLAYADWCDENGQPDRAEYIRLAVAEPHLPGCGQFAYSCAECNFYGTALQCANCQVRFETRARLDALAGAHWKEWAWFENSDVPFVTDNATFFDQRLTFPYDGNALTSPLRRCRLGFRRGFVDEVRAPWEYLRGTLNNYLKLFPITRVELTTAVRVRTRWHVGDTRTIVGLYDSPELGVAHTGDVTDGIRALLTKKWPRVPPSGWVFGPHYELIE